MIWKRKNKSDKQVLHTWYHTACITDSLFCATEGDLQRCRRSVPSAGGRWQSPCGSNPGSSDTEEALNDRTTCGLNIYSLHHICFIISSDFTWLFCSCTFRASPWSSRTTMMPNWSYSFLDLYIHMLLLGFEILTYNFIPWKSSQHIKTHLGRKNKQTTIYNDSTCCSY